MKKDLFKIVPLFIPCLIAIILGCVFLFSDIYDGPTKTISGDISFFDKGSHHRYGSTPMYIELKEINILLLVVLDGLQIFQNYKVHYLSVKQ